MATGLGQLLKQRAPRALWLGQVTSVTGDRLYSVALTWTALTITRSPLAVGLVSLASSVPYLASSLLSGAIADRRDALRLARVVDLSRAAIMAILPITSAFGVLNLTTLISVAAALSALEAFFLPSLQASLPRLVDRDSLSPLVSLLDSTDRLGRIIGSGAVGVLVAAIPEVQLFSINAGTFVASALFLTTLIRLARPWTPPAKTEESRWRVISGGWTALWGEPTLRRATILRFLANVAWPAYTVSVPFIVAQHFHLGIGAYGLSLAFFGIGNLVGNIACARFPTDAPLRRTWISWACAGAGFAALAVAPYYPVFLGAIAIVGVCTPMANVSIDSYIAGNLPEAVLARAFAAQRFLIVAAGTLGLPAFGYLADAATTATALIVAAVAIALTAVIVGISGRRIGVPSAQTSGSTTT